jgi:hypothetical protein
LAAAVSVLPVLAVLPVLTVLTVLPVLTVLTVPVLSVVVAIAIVAIVVAVIAAPASLATVLARVALVRILVLPAVAISPPIVVSVILVRSGHSPRAAARDDSGKARYCKTFHLKALLSSALITQRPPATFRGKARQAHR